MGFKGVEGLGLSVLRFRARTLGAPAVLARSSSWTSQSCQLLVGHASFAAKFVAVPLLSCHIVVLDTPPTAPSNTYHAWQYTETTFFEIGAGLCRTLLSEIHMLLAHDDFSGFRTNVSNYLQGRNLTYGMTETDKKTIRVGLELSTFARVRPPLCQQ